jgi:DNA-binding PadR family transcriptional regulator
MTRGDGDLLLGEWACLGVLAAGPAHGFAVAAHLRPDGDLGRVWSLSRALTYRALDQLVTRGLAEVVGAEQGTAGGQRTILDITPSGRGLLLAWLADPVRHLRDLRSELLLKLLLCRMCGVSERPLLVRQQEVVEQMAGVLATPAQGDVVAIWRSEASQAAVRFVARLLAQ